MPTYPVVDTFKRSHVKTILNSVVIFKERTALKCYMCKEWTAYMADSGPGWGLHLSHTVKIDKVYYVVPKMPEHAECKEAFNLCPPL